MTLEFRKQMNMVRDIAVWWQVNPKLGMRKKKKKQGAPQFPPQNLKKALVLMG